VSENRWLRKLEEDPGHSTWYVERFRAMAAEGQDLVGEARFVDAIAPRGASILDAGCGHGRVGGRLAELGHTVVGVDLDPILIEAARQDHPGSTWLLGDLAELDLNDRDCATRFDAMVCAGNVMGFLDPDTRQRVLERLAATIAPEGRIVTGFGSGGDYPFDEFFADVGCQLL